MKTKLINTASSTLKDQIELNTKNIKLFKAVNRRLRLLEEIICLKNRGVLSEVEDEDE